MTRHDRMVPPAAMTVSQHREISVAAVEFCGLKIRQPGVSVYAHPRARGGDTVDITAISDDARRLAVLDGMHYLAV